MLLPHHAEQHAMNKAHRDTMEKATEKSMGDASKNGSTQIAVMATPRIQVQELNQSVAGHKLQQDLTE